MPRPKTWGDGSPFLEALARLELRAEAPARVPGPEHSSYLGGRPGWSPDREFQPEATCTVCGGTDREILVTLPETPYEAPEIDGDPDPITHGELVTWVCEGCGRTRSRSNFGSLRQPRQDVLDDYEHEDRDIHHSLAGRAQKPRPPAGAEKPRLVGGLERIRR